MVHLHFCDTHGDYWTCQCTAPDARPYLATSQQCPACAYEAARMDRHDASTEEAPA